MQNKTEDKVKEFCEQALVYGFDLKPTEANKMLQYLELLLERNRSINLTAIREFEPGIVLHLIDSLLFVPFINEALINLNKKQSVKKILDIGTGGGFPGVPLRLYYHDRKDLDFILLDSVAKKVKVVSDLSSKLKIESLKTVSMRAEELARKELGLYSVVVARAVAEAKVLIEYAAPFLTMNGSLVISKGQLSKKELEQAKITAKLCGMEIVSRETFELPCDYGVRSLMRIQKRSNSKIKLPRKNGDAKNHPLVI